MALAESDSLLRLVWLGLALVAFHATLALEALDTLAAILAAVNDLRPPPTVIDSRAALRIAPEELAA